MNALVAQLVALVAARFGLSAIATQALLNIALQAVGLLPPDLTAKLEAGAEAIAKEVVLWAISRKAGPPGNPDMGHNEQAPSPPIALDQTPQTDPGP